MNGFLFTVCQAGSEAFLKRELVRERPELKPAYSRPGFITFKSERPVSARTELTSVFARAYGLSIGKASGAAEVVAHARELGQRSLRVHVFERDRHEPGAEPKGFIRGELSTRAKSAILEEAPPGLLLQDPQAAAGESVLDVIVIEEDEWWVGTHAHSPAHSPWPGGDPGLRLPPEAPSRAWLKMEEALLWSAAPLRPGDTAVEIGSAPGGASFALLGRELKVTGVDPAEMDAGVLSHPRFSHLRKTVASLRREELPAVVDWLALDMNVAPSVTLHHIHRLAERMEGTLLGVLLTVKLNEESMADEIPGMLEKVKAMGMARVRAVQLPSNRREIFVYGLTRRGQARSQI